MPTVLVCGGGGFIRSHLVKRLKKGACIGKTVRLTGANFTGPVNIDSGRQGNDWSSGISSRLARSQRRQGAYNRGRVRV